MDAPLAARRETPVYDTPGRWRGMLARAFGIAVFAFILAMAAPAFVDRINKNAGMRFSTQIIFAAGVFGIAGALALAVEWLLMNKTRVAYAIEEAFQVDVTGDGRIGEPQAATPAIWIQRPHENGWDQLQLPGTAEALRELTAGLLRGQGFTEAAWTGKGRPYTKAEFHALRGEFLERGLICQRNPKAPAQGYELTRAGQAAIEKLHAQPPALPRSHAHASRGELLDSPAHTG